MNAKYDDAQPRRPNGGPMVEAVARQPGTPREPTSELDEAASRAAIEAEARTGLPRAANGGPPAVEREFARALVDAGYMPLADYVALFGAEVPARQEPQYVMSEHFRVAFPRRQMYRPTSVRCTFAKPSPRLMRWERRASR
jgi:hypothetical protein